MGWLLRIVGGVVLAVFLSGSAQPAHPQQRPPFANATEKARQQPPPVLVTLSEPEGARQIDRADAADQSLPSPWYDLWAQALMALWAFIQLILSGVGIYLLKKTLDATRAAVVDTSKATEAMLAANVIAEGIAAQGKIEQEARERENVPAVLVVDASYTDLGDNTGEFALRLENVGRQAASDVYVVSVERCFMPEGQWYEERMSISTAFTWLSNVPKDSKRRIGAVGVHPRTKTIPADFTRSPMRNCAYITGTVVYSDAESRDYVSQFFFWLPAENLVRGVSVPMISGSLRMATFKRYDGPELRDREGY